MDSFTKITVLLIASLLIFSRISVIADSADDYKAEAEQGDNFAQHSLGLCYANGLGVPKDMVEAAKWFRKSAEQGNREAQNVLGLLYSFGDGVPLDKAEAAKWFRKSAEKGHHIAQYLLGLAYTIGDGVPLDMAEAEKWFRYAAGNGNEDAQKKLEQISANLAPADNKITSKIKSAMKGKTKAEVKAYFGRPPDGGTSQSWIYHGQYVDNDAEKIYPKCHVTFDVSTDKAVLISFY